MGDVIIQGIVATIPLFIIWLIVEKVLFSKKKNKKENAEQKDNKTNEEETSVDGKENNYPNK